MKAITPLVAGYLYQQSLELPFLICAGLYSVATVTFFIFFRHRKEIEEDERYPTVHPDDDV
jgi:hypothetical protein